MILEHFKRKKYKPVETINIQADMLTKCPECGSMILKNDVSKSFKICPSCDKYLKMTAKERIKSLLDSESFVEYFKEKKRKLEILLIFQNIKISRIFSEKLLEMMKQ